MLSAETKKKIESIYGEEIRYPKDCEALAISISSKTGYHISSSTLKRLLGFVKTVSKPNQYTLDTIAAYLNYNSWDDFKKKEFEDSKFIDLNESKNQNKQKKKIKFGLFFVFILTIFISVFFQFFDKKKSENQKLYALKYKHVTQLPSPRAGGRIIENGEFIYYFGGIENGLVTNTNWLYNVNKNSWKTLNPLPTARAEMGTAKAGKHIYCFGGWLGNHKGMTDRVEVYDIENDTWDTITRLPIKLTGVNAVTYGNYIYILGSITGETSTYFFQYDIKAKKYKSLPLFEKDMMQSSLVLVKNKLYVIGGMSYVKFKYNLYRNVYCFDFNSQKWNEMASLPHATQNSASIFYKGKIHVFGGINKYGENNDGLSNYHFVYDISTNRWKNSDKLPFSIYGHQLAIVKDKLVIFGGITEFPNPNDDVVELDLKNF
jgi:N-acetylneuraminic acid mutarotase